MKTPLEKLAFSKFRSLKNKLVFIVMLASSIALIVSSFTFVLFDRSESKKHVVENLIAVGQLTSERSSAALAFSDSKTVQQNIQSLLGIDTVEYACVYTDDFKLLSSTKKNQKLSPCMREINPISALNRQAENELVVITPISKRNIILGYLLIKGDIQQLNARTFLISISALFLSILAVLIAFFLTFRLQKNLLEPIENLNKIANQVSLTHDYSVRADKKTNDEVGLLVDSFNQMLAKTEGAHSKLKEMVEELEEQGMQLKYHAKDQENRRGEIQHILASASHDLKQPLQAMAIFTEALKEGANTDQGQLLHKLERAIANLKQLFTDLMDVSSIEQRLKTQQLNAAISTSQILEQVLTEFSAMAANKGIYLRSHIQEFQLNTHASTFQRIVRNLLNNALRYTDSGGILLACRQHENAISVEVWDTGKGIAKEKHKSIFNQFVQVSEDKEKHSEGVGLGLSIVKRSCELLGYKVEVYSKPNRGSVFKVKIPLEHVQQAEALSKSAGLNPYPSESQDVILHSLSASTRALEAKTVFFIDDDASVRDALSTLIGQWGMHVMAGESLASLRAQLDEHDQPDLILSDYQISETELGDNIIRRLRQQFGEQVPAIIITGIGQPDAIEQLKRQGFSVLTKPVKPAKLRALISHLIPN